MRKTAAAKLLEPRITGWGCLDVIAALAILATSAGFLSSLGWPVELAAHFRVQYLVVLTVLGGFDAIGRRWLAAGACIGFAAANAAVVAPQVAFAGAPEPAGPPLLRVMLLNVYTANDSYDDVLRMVRQHAPDVIVFQEVDRRWMGELRKLETDYPSPVVETREDNFGIALFSRLPISDGRITEIGGSEVPSVSARIATGGSVVSVVGTHTLPPANRYYAMLRDDQLRALPGFLSKLPSPRILLGDLNTSPWSHEFQRLLAAANLRDGRRGHGLRTSWPANFWPMLIPIDHCLYSPKLAAVRFETGPFVGSDHFPVVVDLVRTSIP